jgi:hypothetical protein
MRRKGQSGTVEEVERLAQTLSTAAINTLARLMRSSRSPAVRLAAANALLDRAWGEPRQQVDVLPPSELTDDELHARLTEIRAERKLTEVGKQMVMLDGTG